MNFSSHKIVAIIFFIVLPLFVFSQDDKTVFTGGASYYAKKFEGRTTANGEKFSNYDMTCASKKLPFNTYLKVTNSKTGISTIVRVNDRGPYKKGRILDLSEQAARIIGTYLHGVTKVEGEIIKPMPLTNELDNIFKSSKISDCYGNNALLSGITISIWRTFDFEHCLLLANHLMETEKINDVLIAVTGKGKSKKYHILISNIRSKKKANKLKDYWERKGFMKVMFFEPQANKHKKQRK